MDGLTSWNGQEGGDLDTFTMTRWDPARQTITSRDRACRETSETLLTGRYTRARLLKNYSVNYLRKKNKCFRARRGLHRSGGRAKSETPPWSSFYTLYLYLLNIVHYLIEGIPSELRLLPTTSLSLPCRQPCRRPDRAPCARRYHCPTSRFPPPSARRGCCRAPWPRRRGRSS